MNTLEEMLSAKIISIIRGVVSDNIVSAVEALERGGVRFVEVTFRPGDEKACADTLKSIEMLKKRFPGMHIGAGTVITVAQVKDAAAAGAEYIISPNTNLNVIEKTKELKLLSLPGAFSPTEIETAWEAGADIVKIFPASTVGPKYFKAVRGPLPNIPLAAVGGISTANIADFLAAGAAAFGIGGNLVSAARVKNAAWQDIENDAAAYVAAVKR